MSFCLLVPLKTLHLSKSRLMVPTVGRAALMRAFARDALAAARASAHVDRVYVVTAEADLDGLTGGTTEVGRLDDLGDGDLNRALRHAERTVRLRHPGLGVAAMCADLPALRPEDLDTALDPTLAGSLGPRWFVADAAGTGTTLLAATAGVDLDPHFGEGSASAHETSGARPVRADVATLRLDVDVQGDLHDAADLGVGRATRALLDAG